MSTLLYYAGNSSKVAITDKPLAPSKSKLTRRPESSSICLTFHIHRQHFSSIICSDLGCHRFGGVSIGLAIEMATPTSKPLGVTAPLSEALPKESEIEASNALIEELKRENNYESAEDTQKR